MDEEWYEGVERARELQHARQSAETELEPVPFALPALLFR
jgi:hypothetical protein